MDCKETDYESTCHILREWYAHGYLTLLLCCDAAFPLLKRLFIAGDPIAVKVFKSEIYERLDMGESRVVPYLIEHGYIDYLDDKTIFKLEDSEFGGTYIKSALQVKSFLSKYYMIMESNKLWEGLQNLLVDEVYIAKAFAIEMGINPPDEGGLFFEILLDFNSSELIEKLYNLTEDELLKILREILEKLANEYQLNEMVTQIFRISEEITLKLINGKTVLFVNEKRFIQCKHLLMTIDTKEIKDFDEIDSIDEAVDQVNTSLEHLQEQIIEIAPEEEFWGHCSNLQTWVENNYDNRLLHSNLAFPLLEKLTYEGDLKAKKIFKDEIAKRFLEEYPSVVVTLVQRDYLSHLNEEEIDILLKSSKKIFTKAQIAVHYSNFDNITKSLDIYYRVKYKDNATKEELRPFAEVWNNIVSYYIEFGDIENAVGAKEKVLSLNPEFRLGWENLGHLYRNSEKYKKAITAYKKAIQRNPNSNSTFSHLALVYQTIGNYLQAREYADQALRINPRDLVAKRIIKELPSSESKKN